MQYVGEKQSEHRIHTRIIWCTVYTPYTVWCNYALMLNKSYMLIYIHCLAPTNECLDLYCQTSMHLLTMASDILHLNTK